MLLCHCAFYLLLPSAVKYSINDNITVLIWHTANLLCFSKTTSILKIMVWVMRLFSPSIQFFSLSIFLKEAHFNSSVEIRCMEGGCFCKLALSVHLQELFFPRVLKRVFFLSTMEKTSSAFCYFLLCLCTLVQQMTQTNVSCRFFFLFLGFYLFIYFFYIFLDNLFFTFLLFFFLTSQIDR